MKGSFPLHDCHAHKLTIVTHRSHALVHSIALAFLIYYRASFLFQDPKARATPLILPWLLVFASELLLSFLWLLGQAYRWRPVTRTVFPERLPDDDKLPPIDVFICTADPYKEPTVDVMNTVLSAVALDYPPEKLHVYLSDDGGSPLTLHCMRESWRFARSWVPFCRRYGITTRCPEAYFSALEDDGGFEGSEFKTYRQKIKEKYEMLKESITKVREGGGPGDSSRITARDHPSIIEVIQEDTGDTVQVDQAKMPMLVYVSREKRPSHPHHFKAGALNVLLRVSSMISNSPYVLVLDCDMYCNDPTSARQAMCFHLDSKISPSLAFVQFPQRFHNISKNDIYDSQLRSVFSVRWQGLDGLKGPMLSGTGFYIKRVSLCGGTIQEDTDIEELKQSFGLSNELIKSLQYRNCRPNLIDDQRRFLKETQFLASCSYESDTRWGKEVGFLYDSVLEDYLTGFTLHCKGWTSVYCDPLRPQFLGSGSTNLNDFLIQNTRWSSGSLEVGFSKFSPLIYGPPRVSLLESMCYGELAFLPLCFLPLWSIATIPQLCLLNGIPLYPKVSNSYFLAFMFVFLSALSMHLLEVLLTGGSFQSWRNEHKDPEKALASMSRREGRDSDSRRHRSRFDREPSPKRSRRDGKPETERVPGNTDLDVGDQTDWDQKHHQRLQDTLPLEAPSAPDSKPENGAVSKESEKKPNEHREGQKHSSNPTEIPRSRSFFQHDERGSASQVGRSIGRKATSERGWRDSKDDERAANKTTYNAQRRDEKLQTKQDDNSVWRHDRFFEKDDPPPPAKKRPSFQEKKISVDFENAKNTETEMVKSSHADYVEGSERREERGRNPRHLDRPEKPSVGDRLPPKRGEAHRDGFLSRERYGGGGGNYRGRERINGRQGYRSDGTRVEKWKHDLYNASGSPTPKNEDDQIAKLEALLGS